MSLLPEELKKRQEEFIKLLTGLNISTHAVLLHKGDDWSWVQYYVLRFLKKECMVVIDDMNRELIRVEETKEMRVGYSKNDQDAVDLVRDYLKEEAEKRKKLLGDLI